MTHKIDSTRIPEINKILKDYRALKIKLRKQKRKLETLEKRFDFLNDLIGVESRGEKLVNAVKKILIEIGYKSVIKTVRIKGKSEIEDLQIIRKNRITLIEVKGLSSKEQSANDSHKIDQYVKLKSAESLDKKIKIVGIYIVNHDNKLKDYRQRHKRPFNNNREIIATKSKHGLISTVDLLEAFLIFKEKKLNFRKFDFNFHKAGLIKF